MNLHCLSFRARACSASPEQDREVRSSQPAGRRHAPRRVHAAQPQRCVKLHTVGNTFTWCKRLFGYCLPRSLARFCPADDNATIRVTNLSEDTRETDLQELFRPFGSISRIYLAKDKNTGQSKVSLSSNYNDM